MSKNNPVFDLVKSMTPTEKRNFIQLSRLQRGRKDYVRLFRLMEESEEWDEKELARQRKFSRLPYLKNYLYNALLKALNVFEDSGEADVVRGIRSVKHLQRRKLFTAGLKLINSLLKKAREQELFDEWIQLLELQLEILLEGQDLKGLEKHLEAINQEINDVEEKKENLRDFTRLHRELFLISKTKFLARGEKDLSPIRKIRKDPLVKSEKMALSKRALQSFYLINYHSDLFLGNYNRALGWSKKVVEIYHDHDFFVSEKPREYILSLYRLSNLYLINSDYNNCLITLEQLRKYKPPKGDLGAEKFENYFLVLLPYCISTGDLDQALDKMKEIRRGINKYRDGMTESNIITFHYLIAEILFMHGDFQDSWAWLRNIIEGPKTTVRQDLQRFARILNLFVQFEKKDTELLDYYLNSTYRYLSKRESLFKFERLIIQFFSSFSLAAGEKEQKKEFISLKNSLKELFEDPFENRVLLYFDVLAWLESKIEGDSLKNVIQNQKMRGRIN